MGVGMRSKALFSAMVFAVALAVGCGPDSPDDVPEFSVLPGTGDGRPTFLRVLGSDGTPFIGQIGDSTGNRTVDGIIPQDYVIENARDSIFGSFTKTRGGRQLLIAQLFRNGQVVSQQQTTVSRGTVTVSSPLDTPDNP